MAAPPQGMGSGTKFPLLRTMMFIDGGYFEHWIENICKIPKNKYHFSNFSEIISKNAFSALRNPLLIRTYYYDGLPDPKYPEYQKTKKFHDELNRNFVNYEVKSITIDKVDGVFKQKGVDTILALDMLEKALSNQYDVAILVAGDRDHTPIAKAVKNSGKQVFGVYYEESYSKELINEFDIGYVLEKKREGTLAKH
ncbi:MAG: NYN domain-containing protein [Thaumarchaeota archaeon]|nr:NYN domain-containing protein [Nitrososphaerota archaeon]